MGSVDDLWMQEGRRAVSSRKAQAAGVVRNGMRYLVRCPGVLSVRSMAFERKWACPGRSRVWATGKQ
jgi:hypothetical protein